MQPYAKGTAPVTAFVPFFLRVMHAISIQHCVICKCY